MALMRAEGDRAAAVDAAVDLCRSALEYRSPERNAVDWAYSQLNLGSALEARAGDIDRYDAVQAYRDVIEQAGAIGEPWLVGEAHYALGSLGLRLAAELDEADDDDEPDPDGEQNRLELLTAAEAASGGPSS